VGDQVERFASMKSPILSFEVENEQKACRSTSGSHNNQSGGGNRKLAMTPGHC